MNFVYALSKLLKINKGSFIKSMGSFLGLPHRYEIFLKKKGVTFVNDSKATSLEATKFALTSSKNIYWILGGLPKYKDKIDLKYIKNNIIRSYIIGKNKNFLKNQLKDKVKFSVVKNLKNAIIRRKKTKYEYAVAILKETKRTYMTFRTLEENGRSTSEAKKYLGYLVKHNIM